MAGRFYRGPRAPTMHPNDRISISVPFLKLVSLAALSATWLAVACSSSTGESSPGQPSGNPACTALGSCCASIGGSIGTACEETASSAELAGAASGSCAAVLQSYELEGYCGGLDAGTGNPVVYDSGTGMGAPACVVSGGVVNGTCDAAPPSDTTTQCQSSNSACADGETFEACVETGPGGACSENLVFSDGTQFACASCTDCAAAAESAAAKCEPLATTADAAPPPDDSGPVDSGPSCGSLPALHPETTPGVYCPFTATGAVHCAAGEECCEAPSGQDSTCQAAGAACPIASSLAWECADPLDCQGSAAGAVCCATGTTAYDSVCGYYRGSGFTGSDLCDELRSGAGRDLLRLERPVREPRAVHAVQGGRSGARYVPLKCRARMSSCYLHDD